MDVISAQQVVIYLASITYVTEGSHHCPPPSHADMNVHSVRADCLHFLNSTHTEPQFPPGAGHYLRWSTNGTTKNGCPATQPHHVGGDHDQCILSWEEWISPSSPRFGLVQTTLPSRRTRIDVTLDTHTEGLPRRPLRWWWIKETDLV